MGEHHQRGRPGAGPRGNPRSWREVCELNKDHPQAADSSTPKASRAARSLCGWRNNSTGGPTPWIGKLRERSQCYGHLVKIEAEKRIGHLFPKIEVTKDLVADRPDLAHLLGQNLVVTAWIWARTVKSPNPAFSHVDVPIVSTFILSSKEGNDVWTEPIVEGDSYRFRVRLGTPPGAVLSSLPLPPRLTVYWQERSKRKCPICAKSSNRTRSQLMIIC